MYSSFVRKTVALITISTLGLLPSYAQNAAPKSGSSQGAPAASPRGQLLREQMLTPDRLGKLELIEEVENGNLAVDADVMEALGVVAGYNTLYKAYGQLDGTYPDIRARAVKALGKAGGDRARELILQALHTENDANAMGSAIVAIAAIGAGSNPGNTIGIVNGAMMREMLKGSSPNSLADDYLTSIDKISPPSANDSQTFDVLVSIADGNYGFNSMVRKSALDEIKRYWGAKTGA